MRVVVLIAALACVALVAVQGAGIPPQRADGFNAIPEEHHERIVGMEKQYLRKNKIVDTKYSMDWVDFLLGKKSTDGPETPEYKCTNVRCTRDLCPDGKGRRQIGDDCCSCGGAKPIVNPK